tara:strand:+ start:11944 stop:13839 length:1896 start_codon:yes stop_codon:yes gene_type:complete
MGGGQIQLLRYGAQNIYLNGNPQITYFKSVYKRHTNFAMENIRIDFEGPQGLLYTSTGVDNTIRCKIPRNADLIDKLYFAFNIPNIYSGYKKSTIDSVEYNTAYEFQWIPNIGSQVIKECTLRIGGNKVSELYGQWIEIWHELFLDTGGKNAFDRMTGHAPEVFMPAHDGVNNGFYPTSSLDPQQNINPDSSNYSFSEFKKNPYLQPPSILGRQIYVPLPFWFTTNPGLALPLIALQYHDVNIEFKLRPISELYTIIDTDPTSNKFKSRIAPNVLISDHHIGNFITNIPSKDFVNGNNLFDGTTNMAGWNIDTHLLVNYIYLDEDERRQFANNNHEYLIEQVNRQTFLGVSGSKSLNLKFNHPVKYMVWFAQRSDISSVFNRHNNYTNWKDEYIPPNSKIYIKNTGADNEDELYYKKYDDGNYITDDNGNFVSFDDVSLVMRNYSIDQNINSLPSWAKKDENPELLKDDFKTFFEDFNNGNYSLKQFEYPLLPTKFNFNYFSETIIKNSRILFDGVERYSSRNSTFFERLQLYQHKFKCDKPGISIYSFCLDPYLNQPSGACNMSRIGTIELEVETNELHPASNNISSNNTLPQKGEKYNLVKTDYNVFVYAINYNILRITGGMAGTAYSN